MNWKITNLEIQKQGESFTDVVIKAHWEVSKEYIDSNDTSQKVRYYDVCTLPAPEGDFVPLDELTEAEVLEWIFANGVDKDFAEDVDEIFPFLVTKDDEDNLKGIKYSKISVLLLNFVKDQQKTIESLENRIRELEQIVNKNNI